MSKTLFVGSLPYSVDNEELVEIFETNGFKVSNPRIIYDRETKNSRGFGFVDFADQGEANRAIEVMDGFLIGNRAIVVKVAEPKPERPKGERRGGSGGHPSNDDVWREERRREKGGRGGR